MKKKSLFLTLALMAATAVSAQTSSPYTGSEVKAGDFFIYNVETGLWLQNNEKNTGDWNTRGATGTYGFDFAITAVDGGWKLDPKFGHNHSMNASNFYLDTSDGVTAWTLEPKTVDGVSNAYTIKSGDNVLGLDGNDNMAWTTDKSTWQLVTRAERIAYMKANASVDNPIDATFLIQDPSFANENERASAWEWNRNGGALDDVRWYRNRRSYAVWNSTSFSLKQTIKDIPFGQYKLTFKGYYRDGNKDDVANRRAAGTERYIGKYFINDTKADIMSILDGASETWVDGLFYYPAADASAPYGHYPDNADAFNRIFQDYPANYTNVGVTASVTAKSMVIGIEKLEANANDWLAFDDFRLTYITSEVDLTTFLQNLNTSIANAEAFDASVTSEVLAKNLTDALTAAKALQSSTDAEAIADATEALTSALSAAQALNVTTLRATVALADAEGLTGDELRNEDGANWSYLVNTLELAKNFLKDGTDNAEMANVLHQLRMSREVFYAERHVIDFKGNEPVDGGEFYLYNVGQHQFFTGGSSYGAHAALGWPGTLVTLKAGTNDKGEGFIIDTHLPNGTNEHYLNAGGFADTGGQDVWGFAAVEGKPGVYNIQRPDNRSLLLGFNPQFAFSGGEAADGVSKMSDNVGSSMQNAANLNNQWILVTAAERLALAENASEANPVDMSYLIQNPGFNQRAALDKWQWTNWSTWGRGSNHTGFVIESYDTTNNHLSQTVEGLPKGMYEVTVQGYYRDGNHNKQAELASDPVQLAIFFAGANETLLPNILTEKDKAPGRGRTSIAGEVPDGCTQASDYFKLGLYEAVIKDVIVTSDGKLTIGVYKDEKYNDGDWVVVDNFRVRMVSSVIDLSLVRKALQNAIAQAQALHTDLKLVVDAIAEGNAAMKLTDGEEIMAVTNKLLDVVNAYKINQNDLNVLRQTITLAEAESVDVTAANNTLQTLTTADMASQVSQALYDLRAARKVNAQRLPDIYTGSAPAEGKVYLYNLGTGMFLGTGSDWNTHAAVDQVGIEVELIADGQGFKMKTNRGGGWMNYNAYVDTGNQDVWFFLPVAGKANVYNISSTAEGIGNLLGYDANGPTDGLHYWSTIAKDRTGFDVANNQWKVITAAEREALIEKATKDNPVDVSYLIKNASLNRQDGYDMWTRERNGEADSRVSTTTNGNGDRAENYGWEFYHTISFSFGQTVENLTPGLYEVSVQAFYRDGNGSYQAGVVNNYGKRLQLAYLNANSEQTPLANIADEAGKVPGIASMQSVAGAFPNWPAEALEYFETGCYTATVPVEVGEDGKLTIAITKSERQNDGDWVVLDNFRLKYLGKQIATPATPTITEVADNGAGMVVEFNVPTTDVDGKNLVVSNLYYKFYTDVEGEVEPLVFKAGNDEGAYESLEADMTEIPYGFEDDMAYFTYGLIYLEMNTTAWNKLGLQTIYKSDDQVAESEIFWYSIREYVGISALSADDANATYTDLQGRRASATAKGLLIKQVRQADGTVKTAKVVRK